MGNERSLFGVGWAPGVTMPSKWRKSKSKPIKSRMMKAMTAGTDTVKDIIGGTPTEVMSKIGIAAVVALWQNFQVMGAAVLGFFILLAVDALFGAILARRRGDAFDAKKLFVGPLIKIALTVAMFLCTTIVDTMLPQAAWIPDSPLFYGAAAFIRVSQLLDVAKKYGTLSGSKVANWIEAKLGTFVKIDPK